MSVVKLFDTTLRDGSQGEKISFSLADKMTIAHRLDDFGVHYIEGGWPGSNPKDAGFFEAARKETWRHARLVAFGSTRRAGVTAAEDRNLQMLLAAETPAISIFGKSWTLHATRALGVELEENVQMIYDSVSLLKSEGREVVYDAEHFFDGYKADSDYALSTLKAAFEAGADVLVLCDTNGGSLPSEISKIVTTVRSLFSTEVGIHAHNDGELAVANSLAAVQAGATHVQGTINGFGERCGNANLIPVIANLELKLGHQCVGKEKLSGLKDLSGFVYEIANVATRDEAAYTGNSAFAHKGGIHVSAVMKDPVLYEHVEPELVGNNRRVLVSDLSGRSNIRYKLEELQIGEADSADVGSLVDEIKNLENDGYYFEAAEASFELLVARRQDNCPEYFCLSGFRISGEKNASDNSRNEASIRVEVDGRVEHTAAEGAGPVNALDNALRKALMRFYPQIAEMILIDYKVRVLNEGDGTASRVRVMIESQAGEARWSTMGVSANIIDATWQALADSFTYFLYKIAKVEKVEEIEYAT